MRFFLHRSLKIYFSILLSLTFSSFLNAQDFLMQGWYWDYPKDGCNAFSGSNWATVLYDKVGELKTAGFTYLWLPPLSRASFGNCSNGYDPKDLYDLGEYGLGRTGFGTRTELNQLISSLNTNGIKAVADVVYNHRDGGKAENNPALKNYINAYDWTRANTGYNPFPYDRYRVILPIGGATGNGAGNYDFKISSSSEHNRFTDLYHKKYKIYIQTNRVGWKNLTALAESEPNGGGDCEPDQANNLIELGRDMYAENETFSGCRTDEFRLVLNSNDYYTDGDTIFIYFGKREESDYSDMRVYGIWSATRNTDIAGELVYQTYTDFTSLASGRGSMNLENFKPNSTNSTKLDGDWDWPWFFYDYDQNITSTRDTLFGWSKWLWDNVGIRGLRMDAVKHFPPSFVGDLLDYLHTNSIDPGLVVGEFYDGNTAALKGWIDQVYTYMDQATKDNIIPRVFDFSLRGALKEACDNFDDNHDVRNVFGAAIVDAGVGANGYNVVTFVGNHDFRESGQYIQNDPILAYAYILTNNQLGLPCVFYPDYYTVSGYPNTTNHIPGAKNQIDALIAVHKQYIVNSAGREYLTSTSTSYNPYFFSGSDKKLLVYQLLNNQTNNDIIVAINFDDTAVNMWVGVDMTAGRVTEGATFGDRIGNSFLQTLTVSGGRVNVQLPARSYAVWVEGQSPVPVELVSFTAKVEKNNVLLNWRTETEVNNYGFEIQKKSLTQTLSEGEGFKEWEKIGFVNGYGNSNSPKEYSFSDKNLQFGSYSYRLKQIDNNGQFEYSNSVFVDIKDNPEEFALYQNYPNPFNPSTKIKYTIPTSNSPLLGGARGGFVTLIVYDVLGNEIATLVNEEQPAGSYEVEFQSTVGSHQLASGVYYYQLKTGDYIQTKKMILLR